MTKIERTTIFFGALVAAALIWVTVAGNPAAQAMRAAGTALVIVGYFLIGSAS